MDKKKNMYNNTQFQFWRIRKIKSAQKTIIDIIYKQKH